MLSLRFSRILNNGVKFGTRLVCTVDPPTCTPLNDSLRVNALICLSTRNSGIFPPVKISILNPRSAAVLYYVFRETTENFWNRFGRIRIGR